MKKNRKNLRRLLFVYVGTLSLCCMACASNEEVLLVPSSTAAEVDDDVTAESNASGSLQDSGVNAGSMHTQEDTIVQNDAGTTEMTAPSGSVSNTAGTGLSGEGYDGNSGDQISTMIIHVCGAVKNPGVYELPWSARVTDAVTAAGGMLEDADAEYVNLAALVSDGDKIRIPTKEEVESLSIDNGVGELEIITSHSMDQSDNDKTKMSDKVNINTADAEELCTLPGIGQTRAESIMAYRRENGEFSAIEDIMKVSGIKENSFQKIKDRITVK